MEKFATILAYIFGTIFTVLTLLRILGYFQYKRDHASQLYDRIRGLRRSYPIAIPGCISIICWAWIISRFF